MQKLLEVKFGSTLRSDPPAQMQLCSLFALSIVLDHALPLPAAASALEGAFVEGVPELSWVADNGAKLQQAGFHGRAWTLISSPQFAERNKVPQENIPKDKEEEVSGRLLRAFERALGLPHGSVQPAARHLQLWGAANPISVTTLPPATPFIYQPSTRTGVCGDWLSAPSIPAAAASGVMLARRIARHHQAEARAARSEGAAVEAQAGDAEVLRTDVGLDCGFKAVAGARPIAAFPGDEAAAAAAAKPKQPPQQQQQQQQKPNQQQQQQRRRRPAHHRFNSSNGDAGTRPMGGGERGGASRRPPQPPSQAAASK